MFNAVIEANNIIRSLEGQGRASEKMIEAYKKQIYEKKVAQYNYDSLINRIFYFSIVFTSTIATMIIIKLI